VHVSKGSGKAKWWLTPEPREKFFYGFKPTNTVESNN
jgi:hypothetical protein